MHDANREERALQHRLGGRHAGVQQEPTAHLTAHRPAIPCDPAARDGALVPTPTGTKGHPVSTWTSCPENPSSPRSTSTTAGPAGPASRGPWRQATLSRGPTPPTAGSVSKYGRSGRQPSRAPVPGRASRPWRTAVLHQLRFSPLHPPGGSEAGGLRPVPVPLRNDGRGRGLEPMTDNQCGAPEPQRHGVPRPAAREYGKRSCTQP